MAKTKKAPVKKVGKKEKPKTHYVCTGGCRYVSEEPGKCPTLGCLRHRNPLEECNCTDDSHNGLFVRNVPDELKDKKFPY